MSGALATMRSRVRIQSAPKSSDSLADSNAMPVNDDLLPLSPEKRTWSAINYATFWISDGLNLNSFMIASSAVVAGLPWWAAWLAVWIGYGSVAFAIVANGHPGSVYHVPFPIIARASFGVWGAAPAVVFRAVFATLWFALQSYLGGQCVTLVLRTLAPSYANLPNGLSASAGVTTQEFLSFFLFWLIQLPAVLTSPQKIRHLFTIKSIVAPIASIAFFAWQVKDAKGLGPIFHQPAKVSGSAFGWAFVGAVLDALNNMILLTVNAPDFTRLAKTTKSQRSTLIALPLTFAITSWIGIVLSASSTVLYGADNQVWNPLDLLKLRLDASPQDSGTRAGVFFIACSFIIAQIGVNIAANSLSTAADLTALLPSYINIRRGGLICALCSLAVCPWYLVASNSNFSTYLSALSLLMSAVLGILLSDYYIVRRGAIDVGSLYTRSSEGVYHYSKGFNIRAYIAWVAGISINFAGFIGVLGVDVSAAAKHIYTLAFFTGSLSSALVYVALCHFYPVMGGVSVRERAWLEPQGKTGWESDNWANKAVPGAAVDEEQASSSGDSDSKEKLGVVSNEDWNDNLQTLPK